MQRRGSNLIYVTYLKSVRKPSLRLADFSDLRPESEDPKISGTHCWIHLTDYNMMIETWKYMVLRLIILLRTVQQFGNVFFNIHDSICKFSNSRNTYTYWLQYLAKFESRFRIFTKELKPLFGPSTWHDSPDQMKRYWICHPRQRVQKGINYGGNEWEAEMVTLETMLDYGLNLP